MTKVLFIITKSNWGGAQRYVYDLATHLPADFTPIVAFGLAQDSDSSGLLGERLAAAGVRTVLVPELGRDIGRADLAAFGALRELFAREKPDVVHLNSSKAGGLGALAARTMRTPRIVFTAHGWAFRESRPLLARVAIWLASLATVALSHEVICVTEADRRAFSWLFPRRMHLIRNALPESPLLKPREEAQHALAPDAPARVRWIGSIGELTKNKGFDTGLRAFAQARAIEPQLFYCIIGDGEDRPLLESLADELRIREHVRFCGTIDNASGYLSAFDLFFLPSRKEGLPYVMLEAHAAGLPVIASSVGGMPEIATPADTLCESGDIAGFATALASPQQEPLPVPSDFAAMLGKTLTLYA